MENKLLVRNKNRTWVEHGSKISNRRMKEVMGCHSQLVAMACSFNLFVITCGLCYDNVLTCFFFFSFFFLIPAIN